MKKVYKHLFLIVLSLTGLIVSLAYLAGNLKLPSISIHIVN